MQKIILVIIAIIVNQIASGQDESKLQDDDILILVNQCCNEENIDPKSLLEISLF
ncbi:hypothetical protein MWU78_15060 [Arenibacter sp. F26102]|uniref:hypothetical protein n=1 Tax=Arenibacter sp. F26102 TaxID=2926416 RepID=UPI001FF3BAC6|nr:hypothetical protein [Arenibacter sp. F26102]MCK0146975.1 hypothetical protein [Arenibacter sp. F26102]